MGSRKWAPTQDPSKNWIRTQLDSCCVRNAVDGRGRTQPAKTCTAGTPACSEPEVIYKKELTCRFPERRVRVGGVTTIFVQAVKTWE